PGHKRRGIWNGVVFDEVFIVNGRYPNESAGGDYRRAANLGRWHTDASSSDSNVSVICVHDCWLARDRHSSYALLHGQTWPAESLRSRGDLRATPDASRSRNRRICSWRWNLARSCGTERRSPRIQGQK